MPKTQKRVPWKGWSLLKPGSYQKTIMLQKCGKKCFLGSKKSFPICNKNTCKVNSKGVYAAYVRGRQFSSRGQKYRTIATKANKMLKKMGVKR